MDNYQTFIAVSRYARWLEDEKRRESWPETVKRYFDYLFNHLETKHNYRPTKKLRAELETAVLNLEVMPSMRALMTAGKALERCNVCAYNCAFLPVDHIRAFDETLYILMCGTGVGFSVERQYIANLPTIDEHFEESDTTIVVADSKSGWARALRELISMLYSGQIPKWDVSRLRPAGARLKTFGGRSSGPEPLVELFQFCVETFRNAAGRKLNSIECHDIMCKIGECVVSGGVRRSAMISLSNFSDMRMREAKTGNWHDYSPHRALANNSVAYTEKPDIGSFMKEWLSLYESKSGERGIFNRVAVQEKADKIGRREANKIVGVNPCGEITLRANEFCNLSEVVVRPEDTLDDLRHKVKLATILGTFQSTFTDFKHIRKVWKTNCEEERLLGVSLTGIMDHISLSNPNYLSEFGKNTGFLTLSDILQELKEEAQTTNLIFSKKLSINSSGAITCVKPSGSVSQLVNSSSGIHARFSPYYIRTVRGSITDPVTKFLQDAGVPNEPCRMRPHNTVVFSFPVKSPETSTYVDELTAIEQLELWKTYQENWCEHNPSCTVYIKEDEWLEVGGWVYANFDKVSGISFLPYSEHNYQQAPYQPISEEEYNKLCETFPKELDWSKLSEYELEDNTKSSQAYACSAESCEIVDI